MPVFEPIRTYIDGLVHPSVRVDAVVTARHRAFIGTHLAAGVAALALLPVYLAVRGAPDAAAVAALAWLASPLALAWFLSASGRFAAAHLASAVAHAGLALTVAAVTGGPASPVMAWLVVIPLQASLSGNRRVMIGAGAIALAALLGMFAADAFGLVPPAAAVLPQGAIMLVAVLAAVVYGTALAFGSGRADGLGRAAALLQDARYRLLAEHMTDLVTRHAPNGAVTFVSPAAESLLGVARRPTSPPTACSPASTSPTGPLISPHSAAPPPKARRARSSSACGAVAPGTSPRPAMCGWRCAAGRSMTACRTAPAGRWWR